jgi:thiol-disulfide isomerase/thioredoxin
MARPPPAHHLEPAVLAVPHRRLHRLQRRQLTQALAGAAAWGLWPLAQAQDAAKDPGKEPGNEPAPAPSPDNASNAPKTPELFEPHTPLGTTLDGQALRIADLPGRALIVCLWAAWCPHCRAEMQVLERVQASISPERLRVLLVNTEPAEDWRKVSRLLDGKLRSLMTHDGDGRVRKALGAPKSVPYTVLLGPDGRNYATLRGWSDSRLDWLVERANIALKAPAR